jgi:hypothetical protein
MNKERGFHLWVGLFSWLAATALLGLGNAFLMFGLGSSSAVAAVLAYAAAAFLDFNSLALLVWGVGHFYAAYKA